MKQKDVTITSPDELNSHLQRTAPMTWVVLGASIVLLAALFAWSFLGKITMKVSGTALIHDGEASLRVESKDSAKLAVGQKVIISGKEGAILSLEGEPLASSFPLSDGEYPFVVVIREIRPIEFLWGSKR